MAKVPTETRVRPRSAYPPLSTTYLWWEEDGDRKEMQVMDGDEIYDDYRWTDFIPSTWMAL